MFYLLAFSALLLGAAVAVQTGVNASLRSALGHPLQATVANFLVGTVAVVLVALALGLRVPDSEALRAAKPWMYLGGLLGAAFVVGTIVLAPRLGGTTLMALIVTGQLGAALVIDHYGWLGFPVSGASPGRMVGVALLIVGVVLVRRG